MTRQQPPVNRIAEKHRKKPTPRTSISQSIVDADNERLDWYKNHPDGEGVTRGRLFQWVRILKDSAHPGKRPKVLATFYLISLDGELVGMKVVDVLKGLPPNPHEWVAVAGLEWVKDVNDPFFATGVWYEQDNVQPFISPEFPEDSRPRNPETGALNYQEFGAYISRESIEQKQAKVPGLRPSYVEPLPGTDGDTQFRFRLKNNTWTVRGSKLAPVLFKLRQAGIQYVRLKDVRQAIAGEGKRS